MLNAARRAKSAFGIARRASSVLCRHEAKPTIVVPVPPITASRLFLGDPVLGAVSRQYTTRTVHKENMDPLLQRLDEDVRRNGRLNRKDLDDILQSIKMQNSVTSSQALLAIRCCGDLVPEELPSVRNKLVDDMWNIFLSRKVPMDISHYNALLRVYVENDHVFDTNAFLKELEIKGLEPNRVTYQRIMWHLCQMGKVEEASHILENMRANSMPLNDAVLDALVLGHVRQGNLEGARSVLKTMTDAGLNPTSKTYSLLMSGYISKGDIEGVKNIFEEGKRADIYFVDRDLMEVVMESAVNGNGEHTQYILDQMQRSAGYNQDAVGLIYRLINKKCYDAASLVLQSMTKLTYSVSSEHNASFYQGAFFVRHLVKTEVPNDIIINICGELVNNYSPNAYLIATESAIQTTNRNLAFELFDCLKSQGKPIRQHYFWPFLCKEKDSKEILEIVKIMQNDFDIILSTETLREFVIPKLKYGPEKTIEILREAGISVAIAVRSVISTLLSDNKITEASRLAKIYGTKTNMKNIKMFLIKAFHQNKDVDAFVNLVKLSCSEELSQKTDQNEDNDNRDVLIQQRNDVGYLVFRAFKLYVNEVYEIDKLLNDMLSNGIGISQEWGERIKTDFKNHMNNDMLEVLRKMTNDELIPPAFDKTNLPSVRRSTEQLEQILIHAEERGENVLGLKKQLLINYCRAKDVDNAEKYLELLKDSNFTLTAGILAIVLDMYCQTDNLEKALTIYKRIISKDPDFIIDDVKILRLAYLLSQENMVEELTNLLQNMPARIKDSDDFEESNVDIACNRLLNVWALKGDVDKVTTVFNILKDKNLIQPTNQTLGSFVRAHLASGNVNEALKCFEDFCIQHRCAPNKVELIKKLIMDEDANGLQKLTDLSTAIHGEINSLYDLVFGFVDCGKVKQARRILETPGMRTRNKRFNDVCEYRGKKNDIDFLERMLEVTNGLNHIDRNVLFQELLNHYVKIEDTEKALGLWTILQEESIPPSTNFLTTLAKYLKKQSLDVPFVVPTKESDVDDIGDRNTKTKDFQKIDSWVYEGEFEKIHSFLLSYLKQGNCSHKLIKYSINKLATSGKVDLMRDIEKHLTDLQKKEFFIENKLCAAIRVAGEVDKYLDELEQRLDTMKDNEELERIFPKGGIYDILSDKKYFSRVETIIKKYADRGIITPISILWSYHLINGNCEESKELWNQYLHDIRHLKYNRIINAAKDRNDTNIITSLMEFVKTNPNTTQKSLGYLCSEKIRILLNSNKIDDVKKVVESIENFGISVEDLDNTVKRRLSSV